MIIDSEWIIIEKKFIRILVHIYDPDNIKKNQDNHQRAEENRE